jgi:hypothetical protein
VKLGREPHLGVDDAVGRQILGALRRDAMQGLGRLQDRHRVREGLEIQLEVPAIGTPGEPLRELGRILGRERAVSHLTGQLDDRLRP